MKMMISIVLALIKMFCFNEGFLLYIRETVFMAISSQFSSLLCLPDAVQSVVHTIDELLYS